MTALEMGSSSLERKYEKERKKAYKVAICGAGYSVRYFTEILSFGHCTHLEIDGNSHFVQMPLYNLFIYFMPTQVIYLFICHTVNKLQI